MERLAEEEASAFIPQLRDRAKSKPSQSLRLETPATTLPRREILVAIFSNIFFLLLIFSPFISMTLTWQRKAHARPCKCLLSHRPTMTDSLDQSEEWAGAFLDPWTVGTAGASTPPGLYLKSRSRSRTHPPCTLRRSARKLLSICCDNTRISGKWLPPQCSGLYKYRWSRGCKWLLLLHFSRPAS